MAKTKLTCHHNTTQILIAPHSHKAYDSYKSVELIRQQSEDGLDTSTCQKTIMWKI